MKGKVDYRPRPCFRCGGAGCDRCKESGFTIGPRSTPVPVSDLGVTEMNLRWLLRPKEER